MISMLGLGLRDATIHAKLFNAMTNLAAFLMFATSDLVIWSAVAVMIPAQILGALLGTRVMLGRGIVLIRPLVVFASWQSNLHLRHGYPDNRGLPNSRDSMVTLVGPLAIGYL